MSERLPDFSMSCPIPLGDYPRVLMAHGGGGTLMRRLIEDMIAPAFGNTGTDGLHDAAAINAPGERLAMTTDSYVVRPWQFPGGDIGSLSIHGTVNDLAMIGARPAWMSAGFIIEEGFAMASLWQIVCSMRDAALDAGVRIVTGDTKVVERGHGDNIYINTAGVGVIEHEPAIGPAAIRPGDAMLLSGDLGRHGIAVMAEREGLAFDTTIESDSASLWPAVEALLSAGVAVHCLRDLTRGGLASALVELADAARVRMVVDERAIPVREDVRGACELLGFDPLYVANEGCFVAFVDAAHADAAREVLIRAGHADAAVVGTVRAADPAGVTLRSLIGAERSLDMLSGEQLPRIC